MPTILVVVPFDDGEGRTEGDSVWNPAIYFPYEEGMTVGQVREIAIKRLMSDWDEESSVDEFVEEYSIECTGGWVVEKSKLDVINSCSFDVGSDSALYGLVHGLKSQIEASAVQTIE